MAVVSFPARNKLAYPSGVRAGIDPTHPASKNLVLSAVAGPGENYINLFTGAPLINQQGSQTNAPSANIHGIVGPAVISLSGGKALGVVSGKTFNALTCAGIFRYSASTVAGYQTIVTLAASRGLWIHGDIPDFFTDSDHNASAALAVNTPYFVAASTIYGTGTPLYIVVKNLVTGQIITTATTQSATAQTGANVCVGNDTVNDFSNFPIAAAMGSDTFLNVPQLLQWADDPWAFWYPPQARSRIAVAAAATFLAGWAQQTNLPVLGTGTY